MTSAVFSTRVEADRLVLEVTGEIDLANVGDFEQALLDLIGRADGHPLVLDVSGLSYIDSTGIKTLMRAQERYDHGSRIALHNPSAAVRRVLELMVPDLFDLL